MTVRKILYLAPLALLLCGASCSRQPERRGIQPPVVQGDRVRFPADSPQLAVIKVESAEPARLETVRLPGRVVWDESRTVRVFAPLAGRITKLTVQPGDAVRQGAALALLSSAELGQAQAEARRAQADVDLAAKNFARVSELHAHGIVSLRDMQSAQADNARAEAEHMRTVMRLKLYGASERVDQALALRSPVSGIVVERNANPGQEVRPDQAQPGTPALFVVSDPSHLWVQLDTPEAVVHALRIGGVFSIRSPSLGDHPLEARIEQVADFVDSQSRTVRVRASVDNPGRRLKAESFITAEVTVDRGSFVRVPASAVLLRGDRQVAFVAEAPGVFRKAPVEAEEAAFGVMRVRRGLAPGERVVTEGALLLQQVFSGARQ
jgi:cobalt-zinc-cadmium efflux system membrane fusion protein